MKPVFQTRDNAIDGNCLAAALASIFEMDIEEFDIDIPNHEGWLQKINDHLIDKVGVYIVTMQSNEPEYFLLGYHLIIARNDTLNAQHAMVGKNGKLVHNPSKGNSQLSNYHYGVFVKYIP